MSTQTFIVNLPSGGKYYAKDNPLSSGEIELKYGTTVEENILMNQSYIKSGVVFDKLLESLIVNQLINHKDLLIGDKNMLLIEARTAMRGNSHSVTYKCTSCGEFTTTNPFNIGDNLYAYEGKSPIIENTSTVEFISSLGNTFHINLPDGHTTQKTENNIKAMKVKRIPVNEVVEYLFYLIDSINGESDATAIRKYLNNMQAIESAEFTDFVYDAAPAVDFFIENACNSCGNIEEVDIPLDVEFFWGKQGQHKRRAR